MRAPGKERGEGAVEHRGDVLLCMGLGEPPGQVEERAGRARVRAGRGGVQEGEPGPVALDAPAHVPARAEERVDRLPGAGGRLATDGAPEGGVGPEHASPLDQGGGDREALEGGGEWAVHRGFSLRSGRR